MTTDGPPVDGAVGWVVLAALALVVAGLAAVRVVPAHERAVVLRLGRVARVAGPGLVLLLPALERVRRVSLGDARVDAVGCRALTRDGVTVWLSASARYRVTDPAACAAAVPGAAVRTREALEEAVRDEVARTDLADLADRAPGAEGRTERLLRAANAETARWGVVVEHVDVVDVDLPLGPELLHWAEARGAARSPGARSSSARSPGPRGPDLPPAATGPRRGPHR